MLDLLRRRDRTCANCGAGTAAGQVWCGSCGDRLGIPVEDAVPDATVEPTEREAPSRRWVVALLVLAVVIAGVAVAQRQPPAEITLGVVGELSGSTATGPPPAGLRRAWAHDGPQVEEFFAVDGPLAVFRADGLVRVGQQVVDLDTGRLVRLARGSSSLDVRGHSATVRHAVLYELDGLTGDLTAVAEVRPGIPDGATSLGGRGTWLFPLERGSAEERATSVLVGRDGSLVAEVDGTALQWIDRAVDDPAVLPVRRIDEDRSGFFDELTTPLRLVDAATGETVRDLLGGRSMVVDVVGDTVLLATTAEEVDQQSGAGGLQWRVRLLDPVTGDERVGAALSSAVAPRVLGTRADGTVLVIGGSGRDATVSAIDPRTGALDAVVTFTVRGASTTSGFVPDTRLLGQVVLAGDLLVTVDDEAEAVTARDPAGSIVWEAPGAATWLAASNGAVVVDRGDAPRLVLDAATGGTLGTVPVETEGVDGPRVSTSIVGVVDGAVGVAAGFGRSQGLGALDGIQWRDLATGQRILPEDVFAATIGDVEDVRLDGQVTFHGLDDSTGVQQPVLSRTVDNASIELFVPGEGFRTIGLPGEDPGAPVDYYARPIAAAPGLFAVVAEEFSQDITVRTHVLDRSTGRWLQRLDDVYGIGLVDDAVLGFGLDEERSLDDVVAVDARTGEVRWSRPVRGLVGAFEPRYDSDALVVGDDIGVTVIDLTDGRDRWARVHRTQLSGHLSLTPSTVVAASTAGEVVAVDRASGDELWRTALGVPVTALSTAGDHVLVGTWDGLVVHLDAAGREVQRLVVGTDAVLSVAALGDTVVAVGGGEVVAYRRDGTGITRQDEVDLP